MKTGYIGDEKIEHMTSEDLKNAGVNLIGSYSLAAMPLTKEQCDQLAAAMKPTPAAMRKATKWERRTLRHTMAKNLKNNHEFFAENKGVTKQLAHAVIRKATK